MLNFAAFPSADSSERAPSATLAPRREDMLALSHAHVIDGTGGAPLEDATILIDGSVVQAVAPDTLVPSEEAQVLDLRGLSVLPGLIDAHVHFGGFVVEDPDWQFTYRSALPFFFDAMRGFRKRRTLALESGVTTVRSAGDNHPQILRLRDRIRAGKLVGPRIIAAGPIFTAPGGHPAGTIYKNNRYVIEHATRQVEDPDEARAEVQRLASDGVDQIKAVYGDANPLDLAHSVPKLQLRVLQALVDEAHRSGLPTMVHVGTAQDAIEAVSAGVDSLEHGMLPGADSSECPAELPATMSDRGTFSVPTLAAAWAMKRMFPDALRNAMRWVAEMHRAGVCIALGTDAGAPGVVIGRAAHRELELLVESGLTPKEAIAVGTCNAAGVIRRGDRLGTTEPGKQADLIAVAGDPLKDIRMTRQVRLVLKAGTAVLNRIGT
jgi:imidazolonepropionase-like amidohydrolase